MSKIVDMGLDDCSGRPTVSVVISSFNSAAMLWNCLSLLLQQTAIDDCEILVIDSGSEQDENRVCAAFMHRHPRLIYEKTPRETIYGAWNRALAKARGEFFVNVNTDDSLHPNAISLLRRALEVHLEAVVAYGDWIWSDIPNASFPWDPAWRYIRHEAYHPAIPLTYCYTGCTQFWRTENLRQLGGFNAERWAAGDYEALTAVVRRQWSAAYVPAPLAAFYQNPAGLSLATGRSIQEFYEIRDRLREQTPISAIYDVDESDGRACAAGWVGLAQRALHVYAPWAPGPEPDFPFAAFAVKNALSRDPANGAAEKLSRALGKKRRTGWDRLLRRQVDTNAALTVPQVAEPPPKVRPFISSVW